MKTFVMIFFALLLTACGGYQISDDRPTTGNIVVLGASVVEGYGVQDTERYADLLQARLNTSGYNYTIINQGISGDTTGDGLKRIDEVIKAEPEIIILALGGNDFIQRKKLDEVEANLRVLVTKIQEVNADILMIGVIAPPTRGFDYSLDSRKVFERVAEDFDLTLMPSYFKGILLDSRYMQSDGIHPKPAGHVKIADNVWELLEPMLRK